MGAVRERLHLRGRVQASLLRKPLNFYTGKGFITFVLSKALRRAYQGLVKAGRGGKKVRLGSTG